MTKHHHYIIVMHIVNGVKVPEDMLHHCVIDNPTIQRLLETTKKNEPVGAGFLIEKQKEKHEQNIKTNHLRLP